MIRLADSDPAKLVEGLEGTIRWAPNDAYAQAHGNKLEYAGRVRGMSKNILPVQGHIHSYYISSSNATPPPRHSFRNDSVCNSIEIAAA
jgi:hypothetical protein